MPNRRAERSEPILPARVDRFHQSCGVLNLPASGIPRMSTPRDEPWGMREFTVVDPSGNLLRIGHDLRDAYIPAGP